MSKTAKIIFWAVEIIILLIIISVVYIYTKKWEEPLDILGDVVLLTDKTEYERGEEIKVTVNNTLDDEIELFIIGVEKFDNDSWEDIRYDIECSCISDCEKMIDRIPGRGTKEYSWDQVDDACQQAKEGKYRFRADWVNPEPGYLIEAPASVSNEFIIK